MRRIALLGAVLMPSCAPTLPASPDPAPAPAPAAPLSELAAPQPTEGSGSAVQVASETSTPSTGVETGASASASTTDGNMPASIGVATSSVTGCLASKDRSEQAARDKTRSAPNPKPVTVTPVAGGAHIVQELAHACCLESTTATKVSGKVVSVEVALSGTPCRCMCSSQVTTNVRLSPGEYTIRVGIDDRGQRKQEPDQKIVVAK